MQIEIDRDKITVVPEDGKIRVVLLLLQQGRTSKEVIEAGFKKQTVYRMKWLLKKYGAVLRLMKNYHTDDEILESSSISRRELTMLKTYLKYIL